MECTTCNGELSDTPCLKCGGVKSPEVKEEEQEDFKLNIVKREEDEECESCSA